MTTILSRRAARAAATSLATLLFIQAVGGSLLAQNPAGVSAVTTPATTGRPGGSVASVRAASSAPGVETAGAAGLYRDPAQGASASDLVRRALASNGELAAARIDIERARARLRQAGLRPNPTLDFEQTSERLTGAGTDRAASV